jgi:hypothetical protein
MARSEPKTLERIAVIGASWAACFLSRGPAVRVRQQQELDAPNLAASQGGYVASAGSFSLLIHPSRWCSGAAASSRSASRWAWPSSTTSRATATDLP